LAAAAHRRDLADEEARLAAEGVAQLERRLERAVWDGEREAAALRARLDERQAELERSLAAHREASRERDELRRRLESHQADLAAARRALESRERELRSQRTEAERRLALVEARLEKSQQRAERFRGSLVELREGRAYRLMRVLWRLRRPFRRTPRDAPAAAPLAEEEADPSPAVRLPPPRPRRREGGERLRVATILDEMSAACFAPECELVPLRLEGWREQLEERPVDLLLVESAWAGNGGEWQYRIARYPRPDLAGLPALRALVGACREGGVPTAFWNKEDPVHFERFAEAASLFDHVFTTDARCIERYEALPGERTVAALPFAAQPRIHNPVAAVPERSGQPCFAGAWYRDRHADRRRSLEGLLDAARPHGLVIYDRRFGEEEDAFGFPDRFAPHVLGKLPYERILDVYKSHRVFLNANSVADSPTMCSRRVFELAACDTAILSTPGAALAALLGKGAVEEAAGEPSAAAALERLLGDEAERRRRTRAARRAVFAEHTYADRLATIAASAGLDMPDRHGDWQLVVQPGVELSAEARADLRAAPAFADADVIGVDRGNGAAPAEHREVDGLDPRVLLFSRDLIEARGLPGGSPEEIEAQLRRWSEEGVRLYAADADLLEPA
jgi:hypothetical protein